jgi:hypothetical protein
MKKEVKNQVKKAGVELVSLLPSPFSFLDDIKSPAEKAIKLGKLHNKIHHLIGKFAYEMVGLNGPACIDNIAQLTQLSKNKIDKARYVYMEELKAKDPLP